MIDPGKYDVDAGVHKITDYRCVSADMQHRSMKKRLYIHLDMNCYYAQVEQQCFELQGFPIYIGGWYKDNGIARGIVATSSYEARLFGVKTGMSAYEAEQICPHIIGMQAHYDKYKLISTEIHKTLKKFSPEIEKYSMDEYFLDITWLKDKSRKYLKDFAQRLQNALFDEVHLYCSIGISYSKTYSKLASDIRKPKGITLVLDQGDVERELWPLRLDEVWGIGSRRYKHLVNEGVITIKDGVERGKGIFQKIFGAYFGWMMWDMIAGNDRARVLTEPAGTPEQLNYMHTFSDWTTDPDQFFGELCRGIHQLCYRMRGYGVRARQYFCYLRVQDAGKKGFGFRFNTDGYTNLDDYILYEAWRQAEPRLKFLLKSGEKMRGIGVGTVQLNTKKQMELFFSEKEGKRDFYLTKDKIMNRFGREYICTAAMMNAVPGKTHFIERNNHEAG